MKEIFEFPGKDELLQQNVEVENQKELELEYRNLELKPYDSIYSYINLPLLAVGKNCFQVRKIKTENVDLDQFKEALIKTIKNHPSLQSRLYKKNDQVYMKYCPEIEPVIEVKNISDKDINSSIQDSLHIFEPFDSQLAYFTILLSETSLYLVVDIFHGVFDGWSGNVFWDTLSRAYLHKELPFDYYYYYLKKYNDQKTLNETYYRTHYDNTTNYLIDFDKNIPQEILKAKNPKIIKVLNFGNLQEKLSQSFESVSQYNIFLAMNILLTQYIYSNYQKNVQEMYIVFAGRNWKKEMYDIGFHLQDVPFRYEFSKDGKINFKALRESLQTQLQNRITLGRCPFDLSQKRIGAIMDIDNIFRQNYVFEDKPCEVVAGCHYEVNEKCEEFVTTIYPRLSIGKNGAMFLYVINAKLYNQATADRYADISEKVGHLIFKYIKNEEDIDLSKELSL